MTEELKPLPNDEEIKQRAIRVFPAPSDSSVELRITAGKFHEFAVEAYTSCGDWLRSQSPDVAKLSAELETMKMQLRSHILDNKPLSVGEIRDILKANAITGEPKVITACGSDGIARDHTIAKGGGK